MRANFIRGEGNITDIGVGRYRDLRQYPLPLREVILKLIEMGYYGQEDHDPVTYNPDENGKYTYQGARLEWSCLFWIPIKSPGQFYSAHEDEYWDPDQTFSVNLILSEIDENSKTAKHHGGKFVSEMDLKIDSRFVDLPDSYERTGISTTEELVLVVVRQVKNIETYIKKYLNKRLKEKREKRIKGLSESNFERGVDPKKALGLDILSKIQDFTESMYKIGYSKNDWLWICAKHGKSDWAKYLVDKEGINVNSADGQALWFATDNNDLDLVKFLLSRGAFTKTTQCVDQALYKGYTEIAKCIEDYVNQKKEAKGSLWWLEESVHFERGIDPKDSMNIGAFKDLKWDDEYRHYPGGDFTGSLIPLSKEEAIKKLIKQELAPYIVTGLPRQPEWTIDYQVRMLNQIIKHKSLPYPDIVPLRAIPKQTMHRIIKELEKRGVIQFDRSKKPFKVSLGKINESINFERGLDPRVSMSIGKSANPIKIEIAEREYSDQGLIKNDGDVELANQNTWMDSIEDHEADYLFKNWEKTVDQYYGFWYKDDEEGEYWAHPSELEDSWIEYKGKKYFIPKTNKFKKISDVMDEGMEFERGVNPKKAMDVGILHKISEQRKKSGWIDATDLEWACYFDHEDYVKILLNNGSDPNPNESRALSYATYSGNPNIVLMLLKAGAHPATIRKPLEEAIKILKDIEDGHHGTVSNQKREDRIKIKNMLAHAVYKWNKVSESKTFTRGKDPRRAMNVGTLAQIKNGMEEDSWATWTDEDGVNDALGWAAFNGHADYVRFLLEMGADPSYSNYEALLEAVREDHKEIVRILMHTGLDIKTVVHHLIDIDDRVDASILQNYIKDLGLKESFNNFERGKAPIRAMEIGKNRDNIFTMIDSIPLENMMGTDWWDKQDDEVLKVAAKMLGVSESKILVACDDSKEPLATQDLEFYYFKRDWDWIQNEKIGDLNLIQSSTGEIYVQDESYDGIGEDPFNIYMLGTIY